MIAYQEIGERLIRYVEQHYGAWLKRERFSLALAMADHRGIEIAVHGKRKTANVAELLREVMLLSVRPTEQGFLISPEEAVRLGVVFGELDQLQRQIDLANAFLEEIGIPAQYLHFEPGYYSQGGLWTYVTSDHPARAPELLERLLPGLRFIPRREAHHGDAIWVQKYFMMDAERIIARRLQEGIEPQAPQAVEGMQGVYALDETTLAVPKAYIPKASKKHSRARSLEALMEAEGVAVSAQNGRHTGVTGLEDYVLARGEDVESMLGVVRRLEARWMERHARSELPTRPLFSR